MIDIEKILPEYQPRPSNAPSILKDVVVLDFTHYLAGPLGTMMLADLGATVIKVEKPGRGDDFRHYPPLHSRMNAQSAAFFWCNRGKKGITLDLKTDQAKKVLDDLIAKADIVVENFSTGVMKGLGLDYESCKRINPQLIYLSISAYGREGDFADRNGYDPVTQAESGFMSTNGYEDRDGVRTTTPVMDIHTGTMAYGAMLAALYHKAKTGEGQYVEMSLYENAVQMNGYNGMKYLFNGEEIGRKANVSPDICPAAVFKCKDRAFYINCGNDRQYLKLVDDVLQRKDLASDERYATMPGRMRHQRELMDALIEEFRQHTWDDLWPRIRKAKIPCGEVRRISQQITAKESRQFKIHTRIPHPEAGWVPNFSSPFHFAKTPVSDPVPSPDVGQHTSEVLANILHYGEQQIKELRDSGAFGPGR